MAEEDAKTVKHLQVMSVQGLAVYASNDNITDALHPTLWSVHKPRGRFVFFHELHITADNRLLDHQISVVGRVKIVCEGISCGSVLK